MGLTQNKPLLYFQFFWIRDYSITYIYSHVYIHLKGYDINQKIEYKYIIPRLVLIKWIDELSFPWEEIYQNWFLIKNYLNKKINYKSSELFYLKKKRFFLNNFHGDDWLLKQSFIK